MKTLMRFPRLVVVLAVIGLAVATARAEIIERVLVKVNGDILTQTDLEMRQSEALRQRRENAAGDEQRRADEGAGRTDAHRADGRG